MKKLISLKPEEVCTALYQKQQRKQVMKNLKKKIV